MQRKIEHIYDNNILIPKEDGGNKLNEADKIEQNEENLKFNNIQEEIRKLHFQLKQKDQLVNSLKAFCERKNNEEKDDFGDGGEESKQELENILHE